MSARTKPLKAQPSVAELKAHYRKSTCPVERRRTQAIWLLAEGKNRKEVEQLVLYSKPQLREIIKRYETQGLAGLRDLQHENRGAPPLLSPEEVAELARVVREDYQWKVLWKGNKVVEWVKDHLGKKIYPQRRHKKADQAQQEEFKKTLPEKGRATLGDFVLPSAPPTEPNAFAQPQTGQTWWYILPELSTRAFKLVLRDFARTLQVGSGKTVLLQLDNAPWHTSKALRFPKGLLPIFQPPIPLNSSPPSASGNSPMSP